MAKLQKVSCANCNKTFYRSKGRVNEGIKRKWKFYCSKKCEYKHRIKKQLLICENCRKSFFRVPSNISSHNYCSKSCAAIINNKKNPRRKTIFKTCLKCGKQFKKSTMNKKYCSRECSVAARKSSDKELIEIIKQMAKELQRIPTRREMKKSSACQKIFGSWNNAIIAAGLTPNRSHSDRMYKRIITKAKDGHSCDSASEAIIDNWLFKNKIPHRKNVPFPNSNFRADWAINLGKDIVFVEYFGLANDSPRYDRSIKEKKSFCKEKNLNLIEIYPQDLYPREFIDKKLKEKFKFLNSGAAGSNR